MLIASEPAPTARSHKEGSAIRHRADRDLWTLVLAGGDGLASRARTAVIVNRDHLPVADEQLGRIAAANVLVQPRNCETGPGIRFALLGLARRRLRVPVVAFPSDHYAANEAALRRHVRSALEIVRRHPRRIVLLGVPPDRPDSGSTDTSSPAGRSRRSESGRRGGSKTSRDGGSVNGTVSAFEESHGGVFWRLPEKRRSIMAKGKSRKAGAQAGSVASLQTQGARVVARLRRDAKALVARSRGELLKDVRAAQQGAHRAIRDLERRVVKQFHAATEEQMKRLERRVTALERQVTALAGRSGSQAA